jgi:DNA helicase-2/ATP-dependent DNA helicase PcrA
MMILLHLVGFRNNSIKHIIIDEIQDYSNIQISVIKKFFPNATFTLLGDTNQTLFPRPLEKLDEAGFTVLNLKNSYRSTEQINEYLEELLPSNLISIGSQGGEVTKMTSKDIYNDIMNILKEADDKVAIITPNKNIFHKIKQFNLDGFKVIEDKDTLYHNKNIVIPYYLAKGFEYNTVVSIGHNKYNNKHIQYIIGSRAINKLYLLNIAD